MTKTRNKSFLDTSIFLEYLKLPLPQSSSHLNSITRNGRLMASSFTVMEINKRLLYVAICYYKKIEELHDVSMAKIILSNKWGREPKYYLILDGLVERNRTQDVKNDYKSYLALLEMVVIDIQDRVYTLVSIFNGAFIKHPLFKTRVFSNEDFAQLVSEADKYDKKDFLDVWKNDVRQLKTALKYFDDLAKTKKLTKNEHSIRNLTQALTSDKPVPSWENMGDLLIALDSPKNNQLLAHDKLFPLLGNMLDKPVQYVDFPTPKL